jgi:DNA-directed RNA polymerase specialized sigma24 family protein
MGSWESSVRPPQQESLDELLDKTVSALCAADVDAQSRRARRLAAAVRGHERTWRRVGVRDEVQVDEVRQTLLVKLWELLQRWANGAERPHNPSAYVRTIGVNAARDFIRIQRKRQSRMGAELTDPVVERSGVFALEDLAANAEEERRLEERSGQLRNHLESYIAAAGRTRVQDPQRMLHAWYGVRVLKRDASEIANELGVTTAAVWKWASRGAGLITDLADSDPDGKRASLMRAAARAA